MRAMTEARDVYFDEPALAAAQQWLHLVLAQASKQHPTDLFKLFKRDSTVCAACHLSWKASLRHRVLTGSSVVDDELPSPSAAHAGTYSQSGKCILQGGLQLCDKLNAVCQLCNIHLLQVLIKQRTVICMHGALVIGTWL